MLASLATFLPLFLLSASQLSCAVPTAARDIQYGTITAPASGTAVQPGANFTFAYEPHADYGVSSFAYHVWLLTSPSASSSAGTLTLPANGASGYYFGRFDYPNYPGELYHSVDVCQ